ncbi:cytochrome c oxidase assembly protein COX20, mitochondrial-like [Haliotis rubra]|uniref:cytochrome c oxidase assembly protein COX20, mitochondrial-like n=1 Tax=Haliotis rubra TaxID=36100 RepID=UPI001EE622DE|nr:cytochrome c oxidase assembly protein COX20, mitochondrial-like [Haliotis rubra]
MAENKESVTLVDDKEEKKRESLLVFGNNIAEIPCFRKSFLVGISSGLGGGIIYFLLTSNTRKAPHVAFGTYFLGTLGTWAYCRYNWSATRFKQRQLQKGLEMKVMYEGTDLERKMLSNADSKEV